MIDAVIAFWKDSWVSVGFTIIFVSLITTMASMVRTFFLVKGDGKLSFLGQSFVSLLYFFAFFIVFGLVMDFYTYYDGHKDFGKISVSENGNKLIEQCDDKDFLKSPNCLQNLVGKKLTFRGQIYRITSPNEVSIELALRQNRSLTLFIRSSFDRRLSDEVLLKYVNVEGVVEKIDSTTLTRDGHLSPAYVPAITNSIILHCSSAKCLKKPYRD